MSNVTVKKSKAHGKGVFANNNFKEGEQIFEIDDSHVDENLSTLSEYQKTYQCDWLKDKTVLMQAPERYINHSCDPNSYVKTINGIRTLFTLRNIHQGEEITYDYAINGYYESDLICNCGSGKCRKILNCDFFQLPKHIQLKYLPYLDDWFVSDFENKINKLQNQLINNKNS